MDKLGDMVVTYARAHAAAGGKAFQLFDSWVGALSPRDFERCVLPVIRRIFDELADLDIPKIYFPGVSSGELLPSLKGIKADVIGLDWRVPIREGRRRLGGGYAVQGNLDPAVLTGPMAVIEEQAADIIDQGLEQPGFVFNLGHGLFPEASLDKIAALTEFIHRYSARQLQNGPAAKEAERA
jgi:Uroporphyrinogen-III decarboxylase